MANPYGYPTPGISGYSLLTPPAPDSGYHQQTAGYPRHSGHTGNFGSYSMTPAAVSPNYMQQGPGMIPSHGHAHYRLQHPCSVERYPAQPKVFIPHTQLAKIQKDQKELAELKETHKKTELEKSFLLDCVTKAYAHFGRPVPQGVSGGAELADMLKRRDRRMRNSSVPGEILEHCKLPEDQPFLTAKQTFALDALSGVKEREFFVSFAEERDNTPDQLLKRLEAFEKDEKQEIIDRLVQDLCKGTDNIPNCRTIDDVELLLKGHRALISKKNEEYFALRDIVRDICRRLDLTFPDVLSEDTLNPLHTSLMKAFDTREKLSKLETDTGNLERVKYELAIIKNEKEALGVRCSQLKDENKKLKEASARWTEEESHPSMEREVSEKPSFSLTATPPWPTSSRGRRSIHHPRKYLEYVCKIPTKDTVKRKHSETVTPSETDNQSTSSNESPTPIRKKHKRRSGPTGWDGELQRNRQKRRQKDQANKLKREQEQFEQQLSEQSSSTTSPC